MAAVRCLLRPLTLSRLIRPSPSVFQSRFKGHSKWQNIKNTKEANDRRKSIACSRYSYRIAAAIRENGNNTDPTSNRPLARVIKEAISEDVPKSTIDNSIKNAKNSKDQMLEDLLELRGPGRAAILVEMMGKSRANMENILRSILKKKGGILERGLLNMFDRKGLIVATNNKSLDEAEEDAIEAGAEEVQVDEDSTFTFMCDPYDLPLVRDKLSEAAYNINSAGVHYLPLNTVELKGRDASLLAKLIESLEENDFVTLVHHNAILKGPS